MELARQFDDDWFIELGGGGKWYPLRINNTITIQEVAHSLAHLCRFTGHARFRSGPLRAYTVAEHSVKVSWLVPTMAALLHDAHECIVNDLATPVKYCVGNGCPGGAGYNEIAKRAAQNIADVFNFSYPIDPAVKRADSILALIEARDLLPSQGKNWPGFSDEIKGAADDLYTDDSLIRPAGWSPEIAYQYFLKRFAELGGKL